MTTIELEAKLEELKIPKDAYSILTGGLPNEQLCIVNEEETWKVYYSERGRRSGIKEFNTESEACVYFYNTLIKYKLL